jgi:hypothetical protein
MGDFTFVVCCTNSLQFQLGWPYIYKTDAYFSSLFYG